MPIENLQAFYKKYYQPDNVVLVVAGKFDEAKALALAEKYLGSIPKPRASSMPPTPRNRPKTASEPSRCALGAVGSAGVAYHVPAASHDDWAPLSILGGIIRAPNGRLYKALVESKLATSANANSDNSHDPGLFFASASCPPESLDAVRDALVKSLESLSDVPFTDDEVNKAKVRSKRNAEMLQSNSQGMSQALSSASSHGDWRLLFIQRDRIAKVTAADVNRVAKAYFQKPNRTLGVYIPAKESTRLAVPSAPPIDVVVKDYKGGTVAEAGEAFDPSPANLDSRIKLINEGGLKAGLLHKKNRGETVSLALSLHYGNQESLKDQTAAAGMLPGIMLAGTKKHDRQSLREEMDFLGIRISSGGGGGRGGRAVAGRRRPARTGPTDVQRRSQARHAATGAQAPGRNLASRPFPPRNLKRRTFSSF